MRIGDRLIWRKPRLDGTVRDTPVQTAPTESAGPRSPSANCSHRTKKKVPITLRVMPPPFRKPNHNPGEPPASAVAHHHPRLNRRLTPSARRSLPRNLPTNTTPPESPRNVETPSAAQTPPIRGDPTRQITRCGRPDTTVCRYQTFRPPPASRRRQPSPPNNRRLTPSSRRNPARHVRSHCFEPCRLSRRNCLTRA